MNSCKYDCFLLPLSCCVCHLQILERLNKMCSSGVWKKQQRLLKNMGAHKVMLDLLQVSYDQVGPVSANLKPSYQVHSPGPCCFICFKDAASFCYLPVHIMDCHQEPQKSFMKFEK